MGRELYYGPDKDDIRKRLLGTICLYQGEPVYILGNRGSTVHFSHLKEYCNSPQVRVEHTDPEFQYQGCQLGYINWADDTHYLSRLPSRDNQKHGLPIDYIQGMKPMLRGGRGDWYLSREFRDCILGIHPSFQEAVGKVEEEGKEGCAFNRHLAIGKFASALSIEYRGRTIGFREQGRWRLMQSTESSFLERICKKAGVPL